MRIIAFGDVHMKLGAMRKIPGIDTADLVLITGDFSNYGGRAELKAILDQVLAVNKNLLALHGNMDKKAAADYLNELDISLHAKGRLINEIGLFGVGGSNITPFNTPSEYSEEALAGFINSGYEMVREVKIMVLVSHTPPFATKTDLIGAGIHVGSTAVRSFIEDKQPALCLTGHIHEARAEDRIGRTLILNPGMISDGGWIDISIDNKQGLNAVLRFS